MAIGWSQDQRLTKMHKQLHKRYVWAGWPHAFVGCRNESQPSAAPLWQLINNNCTLQSARIHLKTKARTLCRTIAVHLHKSVQSQCMHATLDRVLVLGFGTHTGWRLLVTPALRYVSRFTGEAYGTNILMNCATQKLPIYVWSSTSKFEKMLDDNSVNLAINWSTRAPPLK